MDIQPDILAVERGGLFLSLVLLVTGLFIAFLSSDLCATLWRNTNIIVKIMFGAVIAATYLYMFIPQMENLVYWVDEIYWFPQTPKGLTRRLPHR